MVIAQEPTQSLAAWHRPLAADVGITREQEDIALSLMIALGMIIFDEFVQRPPQGALAQRITLDRHSSFTERTQRSA
jgi:hypothetical protein